jgi:signal transduction histidine kinase/ActR/RegA family two-component response regulator
MASNLPPVGVAHHGVSSWLVRFARHAWLAVPRGSSLPGHVWRQRHRGIVTILWCHAIGIGCFSLYTGQSVGHSVFEGGLIGAAALAAAIPLLTRTWRASIAALGLVASSGVLVHLSGGYIELHFHFFVMVGLLTLYQQWIPFLLAIGFVLVHHGVVGVLDPSAVYNHPAAIAHPWRWAAIHALFITAMSIVSLISWRVNELQESERRRRAAEGLAQVRQLISQSLDPQDVNQHIVDSIRVLLAVQTAVVYRLNAQRDELVAMAVSGENGVQASRSLPAGVGAAGLAARERCCVVTPDILGDPRILVTAELRSRVERAGYRAALAVPLVVQGQVIGALGVGDRIGRAFDAEDIRVAQAFTDQAAAAIDNARLVDELKTRQARLEALLAIGQELARIQPVEPLLSRVAEACGRLFNAASVAFRLVEDEDLIVCGTWGASKGVMPAMPMKIGENLTGVVAASGELLVVQDPVNDPRLMLAYREQYRQDGIRGVLALPVKVDEQVIGTLTIRITRDGGFSPADVEIAKAFAGQAAIALENSRLYQETKATLTELSDTKDQLAQAQKMEAIGQLAGGVAHDFNNLLTVITGRSRLFLARVPPEHPGRRDVELIDRAADRAASLTRQLLAFSRKQVLQPKSLDLNALIGGLAPMLRRLIGEDMELMLVERAGLAQVMADPGQLEQVVMNLVVNARDAMPHGGTVKIETERRDLYKATQHAQGLIPPGQYVALTVQDAGCGMDSGTLTKIFDPFFTTKGPGKGTGLGLSTVYGVVLQSGGYIGVDSIVGRGTTFTVYLPQTAAPTDAPESQRRTARLPRGRETILLVEDEDEVRQLASEILKACGYTVLDSNDPLEASLLGERHQGKIALLLTDIVMPAMRGPALAAHILSRDPGVRVLYMSGYTEEMIGSHGMLEPAGVFLQKPFTPETLARAVREALEAKSLAGKEDGSSHGLAVT